MNALTDLLARVEASTSDHQWALFRDAARMLVPDMDDPKRSRINMLCDGGGFTDAALALCERVLPGRSKKIEIDPGSTHCWVWRWDHGWVAEAAKGEASTPALALLAALLKAKIAEAASPAK